MDKDQPDLTQRQIQILKAVIEEYIVTAEPVGSETLEKKYNLGISPATIRNEMVRLSDMRMLSQPHTSSGRSPTPAALRYYVDHMMKPKDMSVAEEVAVKEKVSAIKEFLDTVKLYGEVQTMHGAQQVEALQEEGEDFEKQEKQSAKLEAAI